MSAPLDWVFWCLHRWAGCSDVCTAGLGVLMSVTQTGCGRRRALPGKSTLYTHIHTVHRWVGGRALRPAGDGHHMAGGDTRGPPRLAPHSQLCATDTGAMHHFPAGSPHSASAARFPNTINPENFALVAQHNNKQAPRMVRATCHSSAGARSNVRSADLAN